MIPRLKLLVDPIYTAKKLSRCSVYWLLNGFAESFYKWFPNSEVVFLIPNEYSSFEVDIERNPNWKYLGIRYGVDRYYESFFPSDEHRRLFSEYDGVHGDWDVVLTSRNNGAYWRSLISNTSQVVKFLCLFEPFPQFEFKSTACSGNKSEWVPLTVRSTASYLDFDRIYIGCDYERASVLAEASRCFSPAMLRALADKIEVYFPSLPSWIMNYLSSGEKNKLFNDKDEKLTVLYTQRIGNTQRRFDQVFKSLSNLYVLAGGEVAITICTNSIGSLPTYAQNDATFLTLEKPPREEYYELCKRSHIFLSFSKEEGLPNGLVEATMLGMIGVVYETGWSIGMFGKGYPFFVKNPSDATSKILWIREHRSKAFEMFTEWFNKWFLPNVVNRYRGMSAFPSDVDMHFKEQVRLCKGYENPIGKRILMSDEIGDDVDIMHLPYKGFSQRADLRGLDVRDLAYFKLPRRWVSHFWLRAAAGYVRTNRPWVLRKPQ